jgi:uncharacterized protein YbjQ (UPF0145 family)
MNTLAVRAAAPLFVLALMSSTPTLASDNVFMLQVSDGMASPDLEGKLDPSIHYYFGDAPHPAIVKTFDDYVTNQKTNGFNKTDRKACEWVFSSAMIELDKRARDLGANAVVNIRSFYKKDTYSSATQVECHNGFLITGITLKGTFVKVR